MDEFNASTARDQDEGYRALVELETLYNKKSRSTALNIQGSQIQALTGFIHIFEQYPYPVVINAAILKLADWFRHFNNNVKYYIYKVFKEASDLHLTKVINEDEVVRRILPVLGSNDPISRSITCRILGCMSMIIAEKLDVQFGIIQRLQLATDRIELEAAIWAGDQICARSTRFPSVIFSKVTDKLENPETPFDIKLRLVKIFRHMHQDIGMARQAKLACLKLLDDPDSDSKLVIVTLRTLTLLLSEAVIDRKEQIDRLLTYALNDTREDVRYNVLYDLYLLGKNDIMFDETHIIRFLQVITSAGNVRTQQRAFKCAQNLIETHQKLIVHIITSNSTLSENFTSSVNECEQIMIRSIERKQYSLLIACAKLLYTILNVTLAPKNSNKIQTEDAMDVDIQILPDMKELAHRVAQQITKVDLALISQDKNLKQSNKHKLKELLKVKANFSLLIDDWDRDTSFRNAYNILTNADDDIVAVLLPYLSTISRKCTNLASWFPDQAVEELKKRMNRPSIFVNLVRLLLRTGSPNQSNLTETLENLLYQFGRWDSIAESYTENGWNIYLIGMEAGSCGWYQLMHVTMKGLCKKVDTEACRYWLETLSSLAFAEYTLLSHQQQQAQPNVSMFQPYIESLARIKALQSLDQPRTHQAWFIQLRKEMLEAIQDTMIALSITSAKQQARKMEECAIQFRKIAFRYDFIAQSQFGIDREMLETIESYKICALVCEHATRTFSGSLFFCIDPSLIPLLNAAQTEAEPRLSNRNQSVHMTNLCKVFLTKVTGWEELDHLEEPDRRQTCSKDLKDILQTIMAEPLILPKSLFENRKNIAIQLTTEPKMSEQKPVTLQPNEDLVIKFEGVVQVGRHVKKLEKKIKKAVIVCFVTNQKVLHLSDRLGVNMIFAEPSQELSAIGNQSALIQPPTIYIANVRNSYFTYTGLLSLPKSKVSNASSPLHKREAYINVFVKLLDENSGIWSVGPQQWRKVIW